MQITHSAHVLFLLGQLGDATNSGGGILKKELFHEPPCLKIRHDHASENPIGRE